MQLALHGSLAREANQTVNLHVHVWKGLVEDAFHQDPEGAVATVPRDRYDKLRILLRLRLQCS